MCSHLGNLHKFNKLVQHYFRKFSSKKFWHFPIDYDSIISIVTKDNKIFELQILLEHDDLANKFATKTIDAMSLFQLVQFK
jgi:hypothetical protein